MDWARRTGRRARGWCAGKGAGMRRSGRWAGRWACVRAGQAPQAGVSGVARGAQRTRAAGGRQQAQGARGVRTSRRARQAWARGARGLGVAWCAGWASRGLMQPVWFLTWVFDSGVFLSHRMDSVHEHCSSRIFSKKKNIF